MKERLLFTLAAENGHSVVVEEMLKHMNLETASIVARNIVFCREFGHLMQENIVFCTYKPLLFDTLEQNNAIYTVY